VSDHAARSDTENRFILRTDISADMNMALNRMTFTSGSSRTTSPPTWIAWTLM